MVPGEFHTVALAVSSWFTLGAWGASQVAVADEFSGLLSGVAFLETSRVADPFCLSGVWSAWSVREDWFANHPEPSKCPVSRTAAWTQKNPSMPDLSKCWTG